MTKWIAVLLLTTLIAGSAISAIYKWVDAQGVTHYAESPPEGEATEKLDLSPGPPKERLEKALMKRHAQAEAERKARAPQAVFGTVVIGFVPSGLAVLPDPLSRVTLLIQRDMRKKDLRHPISDANPNWVVAADKGGRSAVSHHNFQLHLPPGDYRVTGIEIESRSISPKPITLPTAGPGFTVPEGRCVYIGRMTYMFQILSPGSFSQSKSMAARLARQRSMPVLMVYLPKGSLVLSTRVFDKPNDGEGEHDLAPLKAAVAADCLLEPAKADVPTRNLSN